MAYKDKFEGLLAAIKTARDENAEYIVVPSPETLGDNYDELVESLNRISAAGLSLKIAPPQKMGRPDFSRN
jgi:hypothetical protein